MLHLNNITYTWLIKSGWSILALDFMAELNKLNPFSENLDIYTILSEVIITATVLSGLIAIAFAIVGGYRYMTATGNPEGVKKATSTITWSIIGLILILSAGLIVQYILDRIRGG